MRTTRRIIPFALLSGLLLSCGSEHRLARVRISQPGVREATTDTACKVPEQIAWTDDKGERHIVTRAEKVYLGSYTLKQCREMEIGLGLDLKGGMNVILEVSVPDVVKALADNKTDEAFNKAVAEASKQSITSQDDFITLFVKEYKKQAPNGKLAELFATQQLKDKVTTRSSDSEVEKVLREEVKAAIDNSYNVLRTRIDRFGVAQPNIQALEGKMGRIMVELPGTVMVQDNEQDYFWLATWGDGVVRFDPSAPEDSMFVYSEIPVNAAGEEDGVILSLVQDDKLGYIWLTTGHDFMSLQIQPDKTLKQLKFQTGLLPVNHMLVEVLKGRGCLWVSAFDRPSFIVHLMDNMTKDYALPALADRVNRSPAVMALCDDGDGMMWMMQERTGLVLYDLKQDKVKIYSDFPELVSLSLDNGREMARARINNGIWVAKDLNRLVYGMTRKGMEMYLEDLIDLNGQVESNATVTKLY